MYREALNHGFAAHAGDRRQEEIAYRTAWSAVKRSYVKDGDHWVARACLKARQADTLQLLNGELR
ncbi:ChaB family protein [Bradyrhizobium sp. th.b2]|uniref:ChaB family protein n=1 Tax=Bradyrhizobium sp. th-b2 TaxID=172088 RepID=UPI0035288ACF